MSCFGGPTFSISGLIGYWDADNYRSYAGSGTSWVNIVDRTSATINGSPTYSSDGFITFDGVDDHVMIPSISQPIKTVISWVRPTVVSGDYVIFGPDSNGADNWLSITSTKLYASFSESADVNGTPVQGTAVLSTNTWYQIACTIDTNTVTLYLNGKQDGSRTVAWTIGPWNTTCAIGRRGSTTQRYFNGNIASVSVYDRVFTVNEIRQNFNALRGRFGI